MLNRSRNILLSSAAVIALAAASAPASAQEVSPNGSLNISVGGFMNFLAAYGDLAEKRGGNEGSYDFRNDTEVIFRIRGTDEGTGIRYGAIVELEADTSTTGNADETYVFIQGNFGEFRFGDDDGLLKDQSIGAESVAVGTGGLDGTIIDTGFLNYVGTTDNDSTRAKYYSPSLAGFEVGLGFTPSSESNGQNLKDTNDGGIDDVIEATLNYDGEFGDFRFRANVGAAWGHQNTTGDDAVGYQGFLGFSAFGFDIAGGYIYQELDDDEAQVYNIGAAYDLGTFGVSVNWGDTIDADGPTFANEPSNLVFGAEASIFPGVATSLEVSFFDEDRGPDDDGVLGVLAILVNF